MNILKYNIINSTILKFVMFASIFSEPFAQVNYLEDTRLEESSSYEDSVGLVKLLASEQSAPFRGRGGSTATNNPRYADAVARFPDVRSCLRDSEAGKETPDLTHFVWSRLRHEFDAEVCIFRIASSYQDVGAVQDWFSAEVFRDVAVFQMEPENLRDKITVSSDWSLSEGLLIGIRNPIRRVLLWLAAYKLSVLVVFDGEGNLQYTEVVYQIN